MLTILLNDTDIIFNYYKITIIMFLLLISVSIQTKILCLKIKPHIK